MNFCKLLNINKNISYYYVYSYRINLIIAIN